MAHVKNNEPVCLLSFMNKLQFEAVEMSVILFNR